MNGEPKLMKMPNYLKKKLKDGMTKESKSGNSKLVNMFYCTILVLDFLRENFFPNGKDHISSKKFIALELSRLIMPKVLTRRWSMGKELSTILQVHLNVEINIIQTMTTEEYIKETFQNTLEP